MPIEKIGQELGWPHCKRLVKIGKKIGKRIGRRLDVFFSTRTTTSAMSEEGKGKAQGGQDAREGGSSHDQRAAKKSKTQMVAKEKNLLLHDEFRKGVAFVQDHNQRWTTISTLSSGGDLLKNTNLRALINQGLQPNMSFAATASCSPAASSSQASSFATAASSPAASCAFQVRLQTQHAPAHYDHSGCSCRCDA